MNISACPFSGAKCSAGHLGDSSEIEAKSAVVARSLGCSKIPCFKQSSNEAEASMLPEKGMKVPALISIFPRPVTTQSLPLAMTPGRIRDLLESNTSSSPLLLVRPSLFISSRHRPQTLPIRSTNPSVRALCFRPDLSSLRRNGSCPRPSSPFPEQVLCVVRPSWCPLTLQHREARCAW